MDEAPDTARRFLTHDTAARAPLLLPHSLGMAEMTSNALHPSTAPCALAIIIASHIVGLPLLAQRGETAVSEAPPASFDVRAYGARGDSVTIDTDAINRAIAAAHAAGGETTIAPRP